MRVRVYFNLHKKVWSVQTKVPGKGWRLMDHALSVVLVNATPRVYENGRQKVLREKRKNVHAFIEGTLVVHDNRDRTMSDTSTVDQVSYNPYKAGHFTLKGTDQEWKGADAVILAGKNVYASREL